MAKYYLGKIEYGKYVPIKLEGVGTGILDVVGFTTRFCSEEELRERLLSEGIIEYYDSEVSIIMEEGPKGDKTYKPIEMGAHLVTILQKKYFDPKFLRRYLQQNKYNQDFYSSLMNYYIKRLNISDTIERILNAMVNQPDRLLHLMNIKKYLNDDAKSIMTKMEKAVIERDCTKVSLLMSDLITTIRTNKHNMINAYYYFKPSVKHMYTGTIDRIDTAYRVIVRANQDGIESFEANPDEDKNLYFYIEEIVNRLVYNYDSKTKKYKKDAAGNRKVNERNLYEVGMFINLYEEYQEELRNRAIRINTPETDEDYEHEEFLEEEDFRKLHTTSEREGYSLRKRDKDFY